MVRSAARRLHLLWSLADHCQTSPAFSFYSLPQAESGPGMWLPPEKECRRVNQPPFLLSSNRVDLRAYQMLLGNWVSGSGCVCVGTWCWAGPSPPYPLGTDVLSELIPPLFSLRDQYPLPLCYFSVALVSNLRGCLHPLGGLVKTQIAEPYARPSDSVAWGGYLGICISNKFPDIVGAAGPGTTL